MCASVHPVPSHTASEEGDTLHLRFKFGFKNPYFNKHFLQQPNGFGEHLLTFDIIFLTWETHATTVSSALSKCG